MKALFALIAVAFVAVNASAQTQLEAFPLWKDGAPGAKGTEAKDIPTLTLFLPDPAKASGAAIVVCPGGGYGGLADHEGSVYAKWLNANGVAAFVLKDRLGSAGYRHPVMLQDAARTLRIVRSRAEEWKIDPKRIGIMGSSAGGHLASTLMTHWDAGKADDADPIERVGSRPDLGILCYPVISMGANTHAGSKKNLLGENPSPELVTLLSSELQVNSNTPPAFVWHTFEDKGVKIENAISFVQALNKANVPFELHTYQKGPHGIGLGSRDGDPAKLHPWTATCLTWLRVQGFVK